MLYRHFKGGLYKMLHDAVIDTESGQLMVVYEQVESGKVYTRPKYMFHDLVELDGQKVLRFSPVKNDK